MLNKYSRILAVNSKTGSIAVIFLVASSLRAIPELLSGIYPVGFDTLQGYVPSILFFPDNSPMKLFGWAYSPLAVYILGSIYTLTRIDVNLLIKIAGPIFYGVFSASFYYLLSNGLKWSTKKSLLVTLILILQPAILRMGWDQFRQELGLIFLFLLLSLSDMSIVTVIKKRSTILPTFAMSLLILFSHQLASVLFFAIFFWQLLTYENKKEKSFATAILAIVPLVLIFGWQIWGQFISPTFNAHFVPLHLPNGTNIFGFTNYFLSDPRFIGGNYLTILNYVGSLSLFSIVALIPFAIMGFSKDRVFLPMLLWLLPASFSILVFPWFALQMYWWWILLLPIPLTVYIGGYLDKSRMFESRGSSRRRKLGIALSIVTVLAFAYATSAVKIIYLDANTYMPSGMVESSIAFSEIRDVNSCLVWINKNSPWNSTIVVQEKIQGISYSSLRFDLQIRVSPSLLTLNQAITLLPNGTDKRYAIWHKNDIAYLGFSGSEITENGNFGIFKISG